MGERRVHRLVFTALVVALVAAVTVTAVLAIRSMEAADSGAWMPSKGVVTTGP